ncbi:MAG: DUF4296 domain-containing protein [Bacteroidales bacterium]|nr:DUF4296 domain-containing protein [Bacteroidales bacterium]
MRGIRNILWLLVVLVIAFACRNEKKVIPREELVPVLVDIHLLDGAIRHSRYREDVKIPDSIDVYEYVLDKHGYTQPQFDSSMNYYSRDPRRFEQIYQEVLARLNRMETEVREEKEERKKKNRPRKDKDLREADPDQPFKVPDELKRKSRKIDRQDKKPVV